MNTVDRTEMHRMATKIALSYARCHKEKFDAFPRLFHTAYQGLMSCATPQPAAQPSTGAKHRSGAGRMNGSSGRANRHYR